MEKPIVIERLMAMCESVATTCCYSLSGERPASFVATLHGGALQGSYVYTYYASGSDSPLPDAWLKWTDGHVDGQFSANTLPVQDQGTWFILKRDTNEMLTIQHAKALGILADTGYCPHEQRNCKYGRTATSEKITHVGSTSPHSAYTEHNSYLADHEAYQYGS